MIFLVSWFSMLLLFMTNIFGQVTMLLQAQTNVFKFQRMKNRAGVVVEEVAGKSTKLTSKEALDMGRGKNRRYVKVFSPMEIVKLLKKNRF